MAPRSIESLRAYNPQDLFSRAATVASAGLGAVGPPWLGADATIVPMRALIFLAPAAAAAMSVSINFEGGSLGRIEKVYSIAAWRPGSERQKPVRRLRRGHGRTDGRAGETAEAAQRPH